jgi:fatty acid desaturase
MPLVDLPLEASRVLMALGLAVFVGGPLAATLGKRGKKIFLEGEEGDALGRARFVAAGFLLVGVLLEVQVMGSSLPARHVWRAAAIFLLVASLVSTVMVVLPRERYYREKSLTFEEDLRQPWVSRADAARRRATRIDFLGFLLAVAALVLG